MSRTNDPSGQSLVSAVAGPDSRKNPQIYERISSVQHLMAVASRTESAMRARSHKGLRGGWFRQGAFVDRFLVPHSIHENRGACC